MRTQNNMTIQDYFRRSGANLSPVRHDLGENVVTGRGGGSFSQALGAAQKTTISKSAPLGLSIRDYAARPVPVRRVLPCDPMVTIPAHTASSNCDKPLPGTAQIDATQPLSVNSADKTRVGLEHGITSEKDQILASIDRAAARYDLPASLIRAVVQAESSYQVRAISPAGAQGLMQLMPATAKEMGVKNPYDIDQNIDGGAKYLRNMLNRFNGDIRLALSAYNAGPGTVAKYNGNVPYPETQNYVQRVIRYTRQST